MTERELIEATAAYYQRLRMETAETDATVERILDVLGDDASDDCGSLLRIERAVRRLKAERDRLRKGGNVAPLNSLNDLPRAWADDWTISNLHFECRRRDLAWAVLPDTVSEYQRRLVAIIALEADSNLRGQSMQASGEIVTQ